MAPLFAGFDVSTQSCKLVVIEPNTGTVRHVDQIDYDRDLPHYETENGAIAGLDEGVLESDPRMWVEAVDRLLGRLRESGVAVEQLRCIAVSGQQHGLVALTADGELARPRSKLWNDFATVEECGILTEAVGGDPAMIAEVGNTQRPGYTAPKILHMRRHEPEYYERAQTFFLVHNYVNWYLTGGANGGVAVMEPGDTSGMALWHPSTARWSRRTIEAIDPELWRKLPEVRPADRVIGRVSPEIVERFGLSPDCQVDAGSGDNMYGAIGTGNYEPGVVTVSLGTSGTAYTFLEEPFIDPTGEIAAFCDSTGHHLPLLCVSNMANGYDAVRERFELSHDAFDKLVERSEPGNGGRVLVPWYVGERTPDVPHATPFYFGFDIGDLKPATLCRAVVEGHVLNLYDGFSRMPVVPREIRLTGGLSNSPAWCQTIADVFATETVPVRGEGAALGAAIHAAWVWNRERSGGMPLTEVASPFITLDETRRRRPLRQREPAYRLLRRLFRALSQRLRGLDAEDPFLIRRDLVALSSADSGKDDEAAAE